MKGPKKGETIAFDFAVLPPKPKTPPAPPVEEEPASHLGPRPEKAAVASELPAVAPRPDSPTASELQAPVASGLPAVAPSVVPQSASPSTARSEQLDARGPASSAPVEQAAAPNAVPSSGRGRSGKWAPPPMAERAPPSAPPPPSSHTPAWSPPPLADRAPRVDGPPPSSAAAPWSPPPLAKPAPAPAAPAEGPRVLTVGQLGRVVGRSLERTFAAELWVEGEVSGARPASSGHVYFQMKDEEEDAAVDVVLYRSSVTPRGRALVKDGARIRVRGKPTYWSPRGKLQFVGDRVEPTGKGALLEALEKLKEKLQAEGLFAPEKKRALPHDPRRIGVVTSASGAVIHDICKVAFRRGGANILLAAAQVQGPGAPESIRRALRMLQRVADVDVIVIGRGGGSSDDLLAFNDELVVRDVAACRVPIVSAVGHEVDVTLVDFAADARAATPSQAAEMIVPDLAARGRLLEERTRRLERAMRARLAEQQTKQAQLMRAFGDPRLLIASAQQRIDDLSYRLTRVVQRRVSNAKEQTTTLDAQLRAQHPQVRIARDRARVSDLDARLALATRHRIRDELAQMTKLTHQLDRLAPHLVRDRADRLARLAGRLDAMSPLKVLARGYAIVTKAGHAIRDAAEVAPGDSLHIRVGEGSFDAEVTKK